MFTIAKQGYKKKKERSSFIIFKCYKGKREAAMSQSYSENLAISKSNSFTVNEIITLIMWTVKTLQPVHKKCLSSYVYSRIADGLKWPLNEQVTSHSFVHIRTHICILTLSRDIVVEHPSEGSTATFLYGCKDWQDTSCLRFALISKTTRLTR